MDFNKILVAVAGLSISIMLFATATDAADKRGPMPPNSIAQDDPILFDAEFDGSTQDFLARNDFSDISPGVPKPEWIIPDNSRDPQDHSKNNLYVMMKSAISLSDGALHITAKKGPVHASPAGNAGVFAYQSGHAHTTRQFKYGYFEIRARMPLEEGMWPALWMFSTKGTAEIDLYEGKSKSALFNGSVVYWRDKPKTSANAFMNPVQNSKPLIYVMRGTWGDAPSHRRAFNANFKLPSAVRSISEDYHIYAVDWQPDGISFYFDNIEYFHVTRSLDDPMYLILNLSLGGAGGPIAAATSLPASLDVDYVRAYQRAPTYVSVQKKPPRLSLSNSEQGSYAIPKYQLE